MRPRALLLAAALAAALALLPAAGAAARPPVVMVVFDEFPSISLLDHHGRVDPKRYPNFAALARGGTWFPNATASVDETGRATEAILTGSTPERKRPRTLAANPDNLFTLLAGRYGLDVSEEATALCPRRYCPRGHVQGTSEMKHELAGGRPERFRRWLRSIVPHRKPTLYFKHALLPHVPLRYLPSGQHYRTSPHEPIPGIVETFSTPWLVDQAYQRHLLQLGFTDRLIGSMIRRLRAQGLYDRSLIVVTADNGEGFGILRQDRHLITERNAANVGLTPLLVKLPHERRGRIVRRHVRTVDIVPTIAHVLKLRLPWRTQGRSVFGPAAGRIPSSLVMIQRSGRRFRLSFPRLRRQAGRVLRQKLRLFGSGDRAPGLYGIGPHRELHATPVSTWRSVTAQHTRASLSEPGALRRVRRSSSFVPVLISGKITRGARRGSRPLAFAVNGFVTATAPTYHLRGRRSEFFSAIVPEAFLHDGANRLQVFAITSAGAGLRLARIL